MTFACFVPGIVRQQGDKQRAKSGHMFEGGAHSRAWRADMIEAFGRARNGAPPIDVPCQVTFFAIFRRPTSHYRTGKNAGLLASTAPLYHAQTPDIDKIERALLDALTYAGVWTDDRLAVHVTKTRLWAERGERPGINVAVAPLSPPYRVGTADVRA